MSWAGLPRTICRGVSPSESDLRALSMSHSSAGNPQGTPAAIHPPATRGHRHHGSQDPRGVQPATQNDSWVPGGRPCGTVPRIRDRGAYCEAFCCDASAPVRGLLHTPVASRPTAPDLNSRLPSPPQLSSPAAGTRSVAPTPGSPAVGGLSYSRLPLGVPAELPCPHPRGD